MRSEVRPGRREAADDRGARSVRGRALDCRLGAGHGEERTTNMLAMIVTLEVSRLSGWLNARADCQEAAEVGRQSRCTQCAGEGSTVDSGQAQGGAHVEHVAHGRDAGGVEAQRLVELTRVLPRVERRACGAG